MATVTKPPSSNPIDTAKSNGRAYALYANGELWQTGHDAYLCGYVSHPENMLTAIDNHEEEMRCLVAEFAHEQGVSYVG